MDVWNIHIQTMLDVSPTATDRGKRDISATWLPLESLQVVKMGDALTPTALEQNYGLYLAQRPTCKNTIQ